MFFFNFCLPLKLLIFFFVRLVGAGGARKLPPSLCFLVRNLMPICPMIICTQVVCILLMDGHLENYTSDYTLQVLVGYCAVYIFMQTFMIPGTIFMSLLAGALFGQLRGVALVVFAATAGASSCYFLSKMIGKPLVFTLWPDKLSFFQRQVAKRREKLLNYMLFLRVTPTLPNTFINLASPIVDVPYHIFLLGTLIGLIPASYVTVRAGIALGELTSLSDLYDTQSIALLFLIGVVSVTPALLGKDEAQEKPSEMAVGAS
ncbi:uncharacterized protein [Zea mays]|uniref:uncharacterized protein isoform X2 n=1 Tax=Zea mays TaxID=4577 RepID=UPI0016524D84|nr:uncharacterized protein LOC100273321 isoform X2 [Zea mays]